MELIKINQIKNAELIPFGIAEKNGVEVLHFFDGDGSDSAASIISTHNDESKIKKTIYVPVANCETIAQKVNLSNTGIIKIDVEGAELEVLNSMSTLIKETQSFIILEVLPPYSAENRQRVDRQEKIFEFIKAQDYLLYRIEINSNNHLDGFKLMPNFEIHGNMHQTNFVLVPKAAQSTFENFKI